MKKQFKVINKIIDKLAPPLVDVGVLNLGPEKFTGSVANGDDVSRSSITGGFNFVNIVGGSDAAKQWIGFLLDSINYGADTVISFDAVVNSGSLAWEVYFNGTAYVSIPQGNHQIKNGHNSFHCPQRSSGASLNYTLSLTSGTVYDIDITNISIREVL